MSGHLSAYCKDHCASCRQPDASEHVTYFLAGSSQYDPSPTCFICKKIWQQGFDSGQSINVATMQQILRNRELEEGEQRRKLGISRGALHEVLAVVQEALQHTGDCATHHESIAFGKCEVCGWDSEQ